MTSSPSTNKCKLFWPAPVCSGNGICDESTGKCICNPGWSSIGDFALEEGADCNINLTAVRALWSIDLACFLITFLVLIGFYYIRCFKSKAPIEWAEPSFQSPIFFTISVFAHCILGALKVSSPSTRVIGGDPATTTVLVFGSCSAVYTSLSFIQLNANFLLSTIKTMPEKARRKIRLQIKAFNNGAPIVYALGFLASIMPMFGLGYPQHIFWFAFAYHFIIAVPIIGFIAFGMHKILSPTLDEIQSHIDSCKTSKSTQDIQIFIDIHKKLSIARKQSDYTCTMISIFFLCLGSWPYITRNGSYICAITSMFGATSMINVWALSNPKKPINSSDEDGLENEHNQHHGNKTVSVKIKDVNEINSGTPNLPSSYTEKEANTSSVQPSN